MPEIIEVEHQRRQLAAALVGRSLVYYESLYARDGKPIFTHLLRKHSPELFERRVLGQRLGALDRIGKNLVFRFPESYSTLQVHLNSTGWWIPGNTLAAETAPSDLFHTSFIKNAASANALAHVMVAFVFDDGQRWYFIDPRTWGRFYAWGDADLMGRGAPCDLAKYGKDWMREPADALQVLLHRNRQSPTTFKAVLLNQFVTAGCGNWMYSEICYHARLHPLEAWAHLNDTDLTQIHNIIVRLIELGLPSDSYWYWQVFGKRDAPCPRCHTPIAYLKDFPGSIRGNYYCPKCQPPRTSRPACTAVQEADALGVPLLITAPARKEAARHTVAAA